MIMCTGTHRAGSQSLTDTCTKTELATKFIDEVSDFDNDIYDVADAFGHIGRMVPEELKTANEVIRGLCGWSLDTLADMAKKVNLDDYDLF